MGLVVFLLSLIIGCGEKGSLYPGIRWSYSFDEAKEVAQKEGKVLMVDFYADWCMWCRHLDNTTFKDQRVVELSKGFVPVKVDCVKNRITPRRYGIKGLPTILFIHPSGKVLKRIIGYKGPDDFLKEMKEVLNISLEAAPQ